MKKWDNLYTLDTKGKVRVFECELTDTNTIITRTGTLGGKLIVKTDYISQGKGGNTATQQAFNEATSLWNEKWDEGYKSAKILLNSDFEVDESEKTIRMILLATPKASQTNRNWDYLPQLAHKWKDIKNPNFPYFIQPKLNGVRCLSKITNQGVLLCSRGGKYYSIPIIQNELSELFIKIEEISNGTIKKENILFDGEVYVHNVPLQDISGAARKIETGFINSNDWLQYHIYDIIDISNLKDTQKDRMQILHALGINSYRSIKFVSTNTVNNKEEVKEYHDIYINNGYEGAILREMQGEYKFNERTRNLLKVKEFLDEEFEIIGHEADENNVGESFVFILKNNTNDLTFKARPTGSINMKVNWANNIHKFKGRKATVRFQERSKDGLPIQAHVRSKDTKCLIIEHIRPTDE